MNICIPQNFVEVSKADFKEALSSINHSREAFWNGEMYNAIGYETVIPSANTTSAQSVRSIPKTVAMSMATGHFFIDPEFFK